MVAIQTQRAYIMSVLFALLNVWSISTHERCSPVTTATGSLNQQVLVLLRVLARSVLIVLIVQGHATIVVKHTSTDTGQMLDDVWYRVMAQLVLSPSVYVNPAKN